MERPAAIGKLALQVLEMESRASEVARLLHDDAGQTLSAIGFHLQALGGDKAATAEIIGHLEQVIASIRLACNKLQSNVVERSGIVIAIELLAERIQQETGLQTRLRFEGDRRLPAPVGHALYRIIELALENVARHSGAPAAEVRVAISGSRVEAAIEDSGRGFAPLGMRTRPPGTGLILMELYANRANLYLNVASRRSRGTIVRIRTF